MRYLPKSPAERQEMLAAIGAQSIEELFSSIPDRFRLRATLDIPGPYSEAEVIQYFKDRAAENSKGYTSFLGAGVYNHLRSVVTDAIIDRKSTRLNSSHTVISYAVFCLEKKKG